MDVLSPTSLMLAGLGLVIIGFFLAAVVQLIYGWPNPGKPYDTPEYADLGGKRLVNAAILLAIVGFCLLLYGGRLYMKESQQTPSATARPRHAGRKRGHSTLLTKIECPLCYGTSPIAVKLMT